MTAQWDNPMYLQTLLADITAALPVEVLGTVIETVMAVRLNPTIADPLADYAWGQVLESLGNMPSNP